MFCFKCKETCPKVTMWKNGTMISVAQHCKKCGNKSFVWSSQPFLFGKHPAGNILFSFGSLMAGLSPNRLILAFQHMNLSVISPRCYFKHQRKYLFPVISGYWIQCRDKLVAKVCALKDVTLSGDGRFDSIGHSAKYCSYSIFCNALGKIIHFELVQVRETIQSFF